MQPLEGILSANLQMACFDFRVHHVVIWLRGHRGTGSHRPNDYGRCMRNGFPRGGMIEISVDRGGFRPAVSK